MARHENQGLVDPRCEVEHLSQYSKSVAKELGRLAHLWTPGSPREPIPKNRLQDIINSPDSDQFVARVQSRMVGAAAISTIKDPFDGRNALLSGVVVHPRFKKMGVHEALIAEAMSWGNIRNLGAIIIPTHPYDQIDARLYEGYGGSVHSVTMLPIDPSG